jgi:hypothetical protein
LLELDSSLAELLELYLSLPALLLDIFPFEEEDFPFSDDEEVPLPLEEDAPFEDDDVSSEEEDVPLDDEEDSYQDDEEVSFEEEDVPSDEEDVALLLEDSS